ncbi:tetratricopeptide repeat protein [Chelativorans sp. YIM 93263]|uniref:tetratricopeptide repeat protein n=1 Tax=Chelativorans sp. YIM 93263 TaxID=2906648 RepID=UPI0023797D21|nr:tetratricopeptide repeat protein [Chelativorans sp. YIM 93263]
MRWKTTAALAALMAVSANTGFASNTGEATETVETHSLSGAFLAARSAELDNDLASASAYYKRALAYDADNAALQQSLLLSLIAQGRLEEALPYAESLKSEPEVERFSRLALAVNAFNEEDYSRAETWLDLVVESDLDRLITGVMTAWAHLGQDDLDGALDQIGSLEGPNWYDFFIDYQRALILAYAGEHDKALDAFEEITGEFALRNMTPGTAARMSHAFAAYLSSRGQQDAAIEVLRNAEDSGAGTANISVLLEQLEAGDTLEQVVASPADGAAEILLNVASELSNGGGDSFVRLYLHYALALRPGNDTILVQLARVAERQKASERAISLYTEIDQDAPWGRFAQFQIGLNLADLERNEEAVTHLTNALEADPDDLRAYLALGGVYAAQKDFASAAELYDQAVAQIDDPQRRHWNIFYQRGIAYERLKEWPKAEPNFKKALELYPEHPQVLNYLGYSWVDMNMNLNEAMDLIRKAVELRPSDGYIVDSLGWAHYKLGNFEEAVEHLERAVSLRPEDPILNDHLGDAYWRIGRRLEARFQWSHARDLDPDADLLAEVQEKLENGLPEEEGDKFANAANTPREIMNDATEVPLAQPKADSEKPDELEGSSLEAEPSIYVVKPGQSLWSIAAEELGDGNRFREILELNPVLQGDAGRIRTGQELKLPE